MGGKSGSAVPGRRGSVPDKAPVNAAKNAAGRRNMNNDDENVAVPKGINPNADPNATINPSKHGVYVGERVEVQSGSKRQGVVMYVGPAEFHGGRTVVGINLDEKRPGSDCDGKHKGERYFRCPEGFGLYIPLEDVKVFYS